MKYVAGIGVWDWVRLFKEKTERIRCHRQGGGDVETLRWDPRLFLFMFSFISLIADGPHHYHPACGHKGSSHLSPVHALQFFYRDASSALLQLVNRWLNFTYSRSHAFRYERKNTNPTLVRFELTTSVLADVQLIPTRPLGRRGCKAKTSCTYHNQNQLDRIVIIDDISAIAPYNTKTITGEEWYSIIY